MSTQVQDSNRWTPSVKLKLPHGFLYIFLIGTLATANI